MYDRNGNFCNVELIPLNCIDGHGEVVDAVGNDVWRRATRYILQERQTWDLVKVVTVLQFQPLRYNNVSHVAQKN